MKTADEFCDYLRDIWNNRLGFPHSEIRDELVGWKRDIEAEVRQLPFTEMKDEWLQDAASKFDLDIHPAATIVETGELRARLEQLEGRMERVEAITAETTRTYAPIRHGPAAPGQSLVETLGPEAQESEA